MTMQENVMEKAAPTGRGGQRHQWPDPSQPKSTLARIFPRLRTTLCMLFKDLHDGMDYLDTKEDATSKSRRKKNQDEGSDNEEGNDGDDEHDDDGDADYSADPDFDVESQHDGPRDIIGEDELLDFLNDCVGTKL